MSTEAKRKLSDSVGQAAKVVRDKMDDIHTTAQEANRVSELISGLDAKIKELASLLKKHMSKPSATGGKRRHASSSHSSAPSSSPSLGSIFGYLIGAFIIIYSVGKTLLSPKTTMQEKLHAAFIAFGGLTLGAMALIFPASAIIFGLTGITFELLASDTIGVYKLSKKIRESYRAKKAFLKALKADPSVETGLKEIANFEKAKLDFSSSCKRLAIKGTEILSAVGLAIPGMVLLFNPITMVPGMILLAVSAVVSFAAAYSSKYVEYKIDKAEKKYDEQFGEHADSIPLRVSNYGERLKALEAEKAEVKVAQAIDDEPAKVNATDFITEKEKMKILIDDIKKKLSSEKSPLHHKAFVSTTLFNHKYDFTTLPEIHAASTVSVDNHIDARFNHGVLIAELEAKLSSDSPVHTDGPGLFDHHHEQARAHAELVRNTPPKFELTAPAYVFSTPAAA